MNCEDYSKFYIVGNICKWYAFVCTILGERRGYHFQMLDKEMVPASRNSHLKRRNVMILSNKDGFCLCAESFPSWLILPNLATNIYLYANIHYSWGLLVINKPSDFYGIGQILSQTTPSREEANPEKSFVWLKYCSCSG